MLDLNKYPAINLELADFDVSKIPVLQQKLQQQLIAIRIYGFTGTGKGSLSKVLNQELGIPYFESSSILRGATYICLEEGIEPKPENIAEIYSKFTVEPTPNQSLQIYYRGDIIPVGELKSAKVDALVPTLAKYRSIFYEMYYKAITSPKSSIILDGRGYNTPYISALAGQGYKLVYIFLDCSTQVRANRYLEARNPNWQDLKLEEKTELLNAFQIGVVERDEKDMEIWETQNIGIIHPETGYIDTSEMTFQEVKETALDFVYRSLGL